MTLAESTIALIVAYAAAMGIAETTASKRCAGQAHLVARLRDGHTITERRATRVARWISAHWPPEHRWPAGIERPLVDVLAPAAASGHPLVSVIKAIDRRKAAMGGEKIDWRAVQQATIDAFAAGTALGKDGRLRSPQALCMALGLNIRVWNDVRDRTVRALAGGAPFKPRAGMRPELLLAALAKAGDARFVGLDAAQAALEKLAASGDPRFSMPPGGAAPDCRGRQEAGGGRGECPRSAAGVFAKRGKRMREKREFGALLLLLLAIVFDWAAWVSA